MYLPIYPKPASMVENGGSYQLSVCAEMRIAVGAMSKERKEMLRGLWSRFCYTAGTLKIIEDLTLPAHTACVGEGECALDDADAYAVSVTEKGICIRGVSDQALLHGIYTLLQMLKPVCLDEGKENIQIDCAEVHDHPALGMRAFHLCIFPETTLLVVEKAIRLAAFLKYSHIVIEFWGAIRLDSFPELGWADRSYTKDEFRPMIDLARTMGMEVIPMINHLGHATQSREGMGRHTILDQNPELSLMFEPDGWTWCLSNPEVHEKLRAVRAELMELCGEGSYFHLGCDESYSYASCPECRKKDPIAMLADYLNGLAEELAQQGRRGIIWGDQLLDATAWDRKLYAATSRPDQKTHLALEKLDRRLVIADWHYRITEPDLPTARHFREHGFDVLTCPWDRPGNATALHAGAEKEGLLGTMDTTWHHMDPMFAKMPEFGGSAWNGASFEPYPGEWAHSASLLRRLMPVARSFARAGYKTHEIDAQYSNLLCCPH